MDPRTLEGFHEKLLEMRVQALEGLSGFAPQESIRGDTCDLTQEYLSGVLQTRVATRNSDFIKRVDAALRRIRTGCYGQCSECEEPIEQPRLEARPITTLCVSCKEDEERVQMGFAQATRRRA